MELALTNIKERHNRCAASYKRTGLVPVGMTFSETPGAVASNGCLLLAKADAP